MDKYYELGRALVFMVLAYNIGNLLLVGVFWSIHYWGDYQGSQLEKIKESALGQLNKRQDLNNYQELVDYDVVKRRESLIKIIDLQDSRKAALINVLDVEKETSDLDFPQKEEQLINKKVENQRRLKEKGKYEVTLRKDTIWRNFVDPVHRTYTIAVETVETFSANKSATPILNTVETNVNVEYSNISKTVFSQG